MLGATFTVAGRLWITGSSPRWSTNTRFGLSAKTYWPAPHVQFSCPGRDSIGLGQSATV